jgi:hypothetical protein
MIDIEKKPGCPCIEFRDSIRPDEIAKTHELARFLESDRLRVSNSARPKRDHFVGGFDTGQIGAMRR